MAALARRVASARKSELRSHPATDPPGATRRASRNVPTPKPHPTSSTRAPAWMPMRSSPNAFSSCSCSSRSKLSSAEIYDENSVPWEADTNPLREIPSLPDWLDIEILLAGRPSIMSLTQVGRERFANEYTVKPAWVTTSALSSRFQWSRRRLLCHPERSRGICGSADLSWKCFSTGTVVGLRPTQADENQP